MLLFILIVGIIILIVFILSRIKPKIRLIIIFSFSITFFSVVIFSLFYNNILKPFEGYNDNLLELDNNNKPLIKQEYYDFFHNYTNVDENKNKYNTKFYYRNGNDCMFPGLTLLFNHYTPYSYSYIIDLSDEYESKKEDFLDSIKFIKTPYMYGNDYDFVSSIIVNNWTFMEIYNENSINTDIPRSYYEAELRKTSYWFSYNDSKKEICFSIMVHDLSLDYYSSIDSIKEYISTNLYTG